MIPHLSSLARLILPCLLLGPTLANAECVPDPDAPPPQNIYTGYPNIGYKGGPEVDPLWHRRVITRHDQDGRDRYRLNTDRVWYDSLEPIDLGGVTGFVAHRAGCARLLDRRGKPLPLPPFAEIAAEYLPASPPGQVIYNLDSGPFESTSRRYVRFVRGRIAAVSPHEYPNSHQGSSLPPGILPQHLRPVALSGPSGQGLLDLHSMREVLQPTWQGIEGIGFYSYDTHYLLADDGQTRTLFSHDGTRRVMERIDNIAVIPDWLPKTAGKTAAERAIIAVRRSGEASCRLYDMRLNLLLPHGIPLLYKECPIRPNQQRPAYLFAEGFDGGTAIYSTQKTPRPQWTGSAPGEYITSVYQTGIVIVRIRTEDGPRYRVYGPDGKPANASDFSDFRSVGCIIEVRLGEQWLTLYHDGKITTKRFWPYGC